MVDEHAAAVLALLNAVVSPQLVVHDGKVPTGAALPYVLPYFTGGYPDLRFKGTTHTFQLRITLHCVAANGQAARQVSDRAAVALLDVRPVVAGRTCYPIRWEDSTPPQRNEATGALVMDQIDTYLLASVPG